ncbi:MAG: enoyl-CoA hydratase/isomerase family protein [Ectothiorhodospiraceae bacterium]|nr:enoyl-CoA hydratase/isomerase family protein [Ectothiorhodospiraceae bacterium]MCH8503768.1 enoyl-CoA hydratase/isomerase family protein [Ectothiorhodospiraceae bacterium]
MPAPLVETRLEGQIAWVVLNRPDRHNALIPELLQELLAALHRLEYQQPRALILAAEGRSFSSGGDVGGFYACPRNERREYSRRVVGLLNDSILQLLRLPFPTIAAVHGMVTGGSIGLVLSCDLVVAGPKAHFAPWYVNVGFSPDGGWTALLPERIGRGRALEIQLLNGTIGAQQALDWGLISRLAEQGKERELASALAAEISGKQIGSVHRTLQLTRPDHDRVASGLDAELRNFLDQIDTEEADRGMAAFLGKA